MGKDYTYDVFISKESSNYQLAKALYDFLSERNLKVFLSEVTLRQLGKDQFQSSLDIGIDNSKNLVVICSERDTASKWVEEEWRNFIALRNTEWRDTRVFTLRVHGSGIDCIPKGLKQYESYSENEFESLYSIIVNRNIEEYVIEGKSLYLTKILSGPLSQASEHYFCLDAVEYSENKRVSDEQMSVELQFVDEWDLHNDSRINDIPELSDDKYCDGNADDADIRESIAIPILDVIKYTPQFILLGNPGAGKSTTLKKLLFDYSVSFSLKETTYIPLYLELNKIHDNIRSSIENAAGGFWINELIHKGQVLFLFDGLNEISLNKRDSILSELKDLLEKYSLCPMIFTSRIYGYINHFNLPTYKLLCLSQPSINLFIKQQGVNIKLYDTIGRNKGLSDLASSPLMLSMVINMWKQNEILPANKTQLYEAFVNEKLKRESGKRVVHISPKYLKEILSCLAYNMKCKTHLSVYRDDLKQILEDILEQKGFCL